MRYVIGSFLAIAVLELALHNRRKHNTPEDGFPVVDTSKSAFAQFTSNLGISKKQADALWASLLTTAVEADDEPEAEPVSDEENVSNLARRQRELEFLQKRVDPYLGLDD